VEVARSLVYQIFIYLDLPFLSCNYLLQHNSHIIFPGKIMYRTEYGNRLIPHTLQGLMY
jgi:hypothetical protein